jgi:hypothetical protein
MAGQESESLKSSKLATAFVIILHIFRGFWQRLVLLVKRCGENIIEKTPKQLGSGAKKCCRSEKKKPR